MKKTLIAGLLAFAVMLTSCATAVTVLPEKKTEPETAATATETKDEPIDVSGAFSVGFSKQDMTPKGRVPLGGYGNMKTRISTVVSDRIYATFVAVTDKDDNTVLIVTLDLVSIPESAAATAAKTIKNTTGIPEENIILCCTHTHASVSIGTVSPLIDAWGVTFYEAMRAGAKAALADRDLTDIYIGTTAVQGMNFVRRYLCENGGYCGDNYPNPTSPVAHETEADNNLQVIKFDRNEKKDIVLANFGAHAAFSQGSDTFISADFIGVVRDNIEKNTGMNFAFFQAAAGNLNPKGKLSGEAPYGDKFTYGAELAKQIVNTLSNMKKVDSGEVKAQKRAVTLDVDHSLDSKYDIALKIYNMYYEGGDKNEALSLVAQNGFDSIFTATHIIARYSYGATEDVNIYAFSIGDVAFIGAPYEMFDTNGMEIKSGSPFDMTFICEQTNGSYGYVPSQLACEHGGYEATSCKFVAGAGEILSAAFVEMLTEMHNN